MTRCDPKAVLRCTSYGTRGPQDSICVLVQNPLFMLECDPIAALEPSHSEERSGVYRQGVWQRTGLVR
jgi:hypothetical protein